MAAPNLAALFDFEGQFETAASAVLEASGINAFISQDPKKLPLINTGITLETGPALDQLFFLPIATGQTVPNEQEYMRYTATLVLEVSVNRDTQRQPAFEGVTTFLAQTRSLVRAAFMRSQWPFDDTNLPYYRVSDIRPMGTNDGSDEVRNVDLISLRFVITFAIQPTAWPIGFPPS